MPRNGNTGTDQVGSMPAESNINFKVKVFSAPRGRGETLERERERHWLRALLLSFLSFSADPYPPATISLRLRCSWREVIYKLHLAV